MIDLLLPTLHDAATRVSHSALPDAPVIAKPRPGPVRRGSARLLREVATRLDHDAAIPATPRLTAS